ncbi:hypothetical protein ACTGUT_10215, partial [Streptococcus suis]
AKKIVQDNRDKRKTQTVRLNFIKISLNLSVFFIYWLVFAQPRFCMQKIPTIWSGFSGDYEKYLGLTIV